jgi:hypothetical protein
VGAAIRPFEQHHAKLALDLSDSHFDFLHCNLRFFWA